jgi:hypothetical protein
LVDDEVEENSVSDFRFLHLTFEIAIAFFFIFLICCSLENFPENFKKNHNIQNIHKTSAMGWEWEAECNLE